MANERMEIAIPQAAIDDLHRRLDNARRPDPVAGYGWEDGTDASFLADLMDHWRHRYDWREREAALNRFEHRVAQVDGERIHFIHAPAEGADPVPLLLMHGWPSSFVQMLDIIPLLTAARTDGACSFEVIAASLPGYPFTRMPRRPGMSFARIADLMVQLMCEEMGWSRFAVRGSDQGGIVLQQLGLRHPERLIGLHRSGIAPIDHPMPTDLGPDEAEYQRQVASWARRETAYAALQRTRPETLVPALTDSPLALAAWFVEKFQRWGDCRNGLIATFGLDRLLDNLSLHWFTKSAAGATRLYREGARDPGAHGRVAVPTAIMMPLHDGATVPAPRSWCERSYNVVRWTIMHRGGHFPEWEVPELVADDIRGFFTALLAHPRAELVSTSGRGG